MFSRPQAQPLPPPPVIEDTDAKRKEYESMLRSRRGRAASILTDRSVNNTPQTAAKTLLGM